MRGFVFVAGGDTRGANIDLRFPFVLRVHDTAANSEVLIVGEVAIYFAYFCNVLAADGNHSLPEVVFHHVSLVEVLAVTMPVFSIGGAKSLGNELAAQMKLVTDNVSVVVLKDTGHGSWRSVRRKRATPWLTSPRASAVSRRGTVTPGGTACDLSMFTQSLELEAFFEG